MRRIVVTTSALALAACGLLADDLSTEPPLDSDDDAGGTSSSGGTARDGAGTPTGEGGRTEEDGPIIDDLDAATPVQDAGTTDADADAGVAPPPFVLDCAGTVLCDGFERTTNLETPLVGRWRDNQFAGGTATLASGTAAAGQGFLRFDSPANTAATSKLLLLGDNQLRFTNNVDPLVVVDLDMHIFARSVMGAGDRRNLIGIMPYSSNPDTHQEYAGVSISAEKGLHAEIREYASATATTRKTDRFGTFPIETLTSTWHHVHMEAKFARNTTGSFVVDIDGVTVASITNIITRTQSAHADLFVFWIGVNAGAGTPAYSIRYDNVEVRAR